MSGEFWEAKSAISRTRKVGTADSQSEELQVLGLGKPWSIEGMEECYIIEPLAIPGLSHGVNLGITVLKKYNLKLICTEEEVFLMPPKHKSDMRAWLVDGGRHSFIRQRLGKVLKAKEAQRISTQVWRNPHERVSINAVSERLEEAV